MIVFLVLFISLSGYVTSFSCPNTVKQYCRCFTSYGGDANRQESNHVDCSSRELYQLPYMDFNEGTRIHKFSIHNNSLITFTSMTFTRKTYIQEVDISRNPLGNSLETGLFKKCVTGLKVFAAREIGLNLQRETSLAFLREIHSLEELDISRNMEYGVQMLPSLFIENEFYKLKKLSLALCRIEDVNAHAFIGLTNLRELDLSENFLTRIPNALNRLSLLRKLYLRQNDITVVRHGDFSELYCLQVLDLSNNLLGQIESFRNGALFGMRNSLTHFNASGSDLAFIPTMALSELKRLKHLDVSYNRISFMTNRSFVGKYRLSTLDISGNPWLINDDMFNGIHDSLIKLRMRDIGLSFIPTIPLSTLKKLRELDLSYNELKTLSNDSLIGIKARILSFIGNKIRFISPHAFSDYKLPIAVDVSNNVLDSIGFVFESEKCTFFRLNISNNGFLCDCHIEKMINSKRIRSLVGNCKMGNRTVSFNNALMTSSLQTKCGKSPATYCTWWVPKSSGNHMNTSVLHVLLVVYLCVHFQKIGHVE